MVYRYESSGFSAIKAPECFHIENELKRLCDIPVMHDDQHGTAVVVGAAMLNALEIQNKQISQAKVVVNGAGAAAMACTRLSAKTMGRGAMVRTISGVRTSATDRPMNTSASTIAWARVPSTTSRGTAVACDCM